MRLQRTIAFVSICILSIVVSPRESNAFGRGDIYGGVHATLDRFFYEYGGARELANKAFGVLVVPQVVKAVI